MYAATRDHTPSLTAPRSATAEFTPLELRVLGLAASGSEQPSTSVEPYWRRTARRVSAVLFARRGGSELADPRLEALRGYAASVRLGRSDGLPLFHAAGYSAAQAQTVKRLVAATAAATPRRSRRDRLAYTGGLSLGIVSITGFLALTGALLAGF